LAQAFFIALGIFKPQKINGLNTAPDLFTRLRIEKMIKTLSCPDAHMMATLWADIEVALELCAVEDRLTTGTTGPKSLRHRPLSRSIGLDPGR
jgi:hypothetical protein